IGPRAFRSPSPRQQSNHLEPIRAPPDRLRKRRRETPRTSLRGSTCSLTWTLSLMPTRWENREKMNFTTHRISAPTRPGYGGALQTDSAPSPP
ncbi:hypothetical protein CRUP_028472, partial [Coryphaenoides rupestris]